MNHHHRDQADNKQTPQGGFEPLNSALEVGNFQSKVGINSRSIPTCYIIPC